MLAAYEAANTRAALFDRTARARLDVLGPDRAKFLQNLTTNEIKRLAPGRGVEAFITSPQGKTLAYTTVLALDDKLVLRGDAGMLDRARPHLEKYGLFDDVRLDDAGPRTFEFHLAGPSAVALIGPSAPVCELDHATIKVGTVAVRVIREAPTGLPGITLIGAIEDADAIRAALGEVALGDDASFDILRIEAGTPVDGVDVRPDNLPQEVGRDARAISFVKGCYLGQETVARIDAIGHVNRIFSGLRIEGDAAPVPGASLSFEGKTVGVITSSAVSPGRGGPIALGYVRVAQAEPGTTLSVEIGGAARSATVVDLPMRPPAL